jgi:hypothetical protein
MQLRSSDIAARPIVNSDFCDFGKFLLSAGARRRRLPGHNFNRSLGFGCGASSDVDCAGDWRSPTGPPARSIRRSGPK